MPDDPYRAFDPRAYLRQYYTTPDVAGDERAVFHRLTDLVRRVGEFSTAIDVGCGPTLHHAFPLAPHAREVHLADYLPGNLAEVRRWLDGAPGAHDWNPYFRGVLRIEGTPEERLAGRAAELRRKVTALKHCDLRRPDPLGDRATYDLVTSFFTAECMTGERAEWEAALGRLLGLVGPGGTVFLAALRDSTRYAVLGHWFPTVPVTEADFPPLLARHGFRSETIVAEGVAVPDWADEGFDGICVVSGTKG